MTADLLRRFYDTWYRPDNAAVMVVGDIDIDEVEELVRDRFEGMGARADAAERPNLDMPAFTEAEAVVLGDPDASADVGRAHVSPLRSPRAATACAPFATSVLTVSRRSRWSPLAWPTTSRGTMHVRASPSASNNDLVRTLNAPSVFVTADVAETEAAANALVSEFERVRRFGIDDNELDRALAYYRSGLEADFDARNTRGDGEYADDFVANFLDTTR